MIFNFDLSDVPNLAWDRGTEIPANADLDDYHTPGVYYCENATKAATIANSPYTAGNFKLIVASSGSPTLTSYTIQIVMSGSSMARHNFVLRACGSGTWSDWRRYITEDDFYYAANDTFSISEQLVSNGFISESSKSIFFTVYVDKSLKNISTITATAMNGALRGSDGYIDVGSAGVNFISTTGYTVTATKVSEHMVLIKIVKSTAFVWNGTSTTVPTNRPISFYGKMTLKFT